MEKKEKPVQRAITHVRLTSRGYLVKLPASARERATVPTSPVRTRAVRHTARVTLSSLSIVSSTNVGVVWLVLTVLVYWAE